MPGQNELRREIDQLKRRCHNLEPRDIEAVARRAGYEYDRTKGSHATYIKARHPNLIIKLHDLGGDLARRLLNQIASSLEDDEED